MMEPETITREQLLWRKKAYLVQEEQIMRRAKAERVSPGKIVAESYAKQRDRQRQQNQSLTTDEYAANIRAGQEKIFGAPSLKIQDEKPPTP